MPFHSKIQPINANGVVDESDFLPAMRQASKYGLKRIFERTIFERQFSLKNIACEDPLLSNDISEEFEPSSYCLRKMVENYMEDPDYVKPHRCNGRNNYNCCFSGSGTDSSDEEDSPSLREVKVLVRCANDSEKTLVEKTTEIVEGDNNCKTEEEDSPLIDVDSSLEAVDLPLEAVDLQLEAVDSPLEAVDLLLEAVDSPLEAVDSPLETVDSPLEAVDSPLKPVDSPLETVDSQLEAVDSPLEAVVLPLETVDSPLEAVDSPLKTVDSPLETMDSQLEVVDSPLEAVVLPLEAVNSPLEAEHWKPWFCRREAADAPLVYSPQLVDSPLEIIDSQLKIVDSPLKTVVEGLVALGYDAAICKSQRPKSKKLVRPPGDDEYLDVMIGGERLLIDIDFKSKFKIARPTKTYKMISETLPYIFVGQMDRLKNIVVVVSEAAKKSFKKKGLYMAPWRNSENVLTKWMSPCVRTKPSQGETSGDANEIED